MRTSVWLRGMPVLIVGMLIGLGLGQPAAAQQDLLGYWSFNAPEGSGNPWPTPVEATFGDGEITYAFTESNVESFAGDGDNAQGGDSAGDSFVIQDDAENGNHFDIAVSTENAENIELVFWARRTGTGFDNNTVSYSTDGGATFTQEFTFDPDDTTSGTVETFDFSGITALNNNSDVVFRITLNGATSATGNNRFDNITVRGDLQPASGPLALTAIDEPTRLNFQGFRAGGFDASPSFGQLDSDAVAVFGASDGNVDFGQTATGGDFARGSSTGGVGTGGVYAFDISKPTDLDNGYGDYALGLQPAGSDFSPGTVYVCYENNTGTAINDGADVDYDLWTLNDTDRSRTVTLKYAVGASCQTDAADASSFNDGQLAFTVEESADSDPEWMRNALSGRIPAGVPSGEFLTLAFVTTDGGGSGGSPEVALNDIAVTPRSTPGGPIVISNTDDTLIEDFDSFAGSGFDSPPESPEQLDSGAFIVRGLSDGDLGFGNTEDSGDFARGASTGGESTGGIYAFEVASGDFAWGVQPTGSDATPGAFVARYLNDTGEPITDAFVGYDIEVLNNEGRSTDVSLAYQVTSSTSYDASGFTGISAFDYTTPKAADSSPTWQTVPRSGTLADINLQNGEYLLLRWETDDAAGSGSRDEIALNNLSLTPNPPTVSFVDTERAVWSTDDTATFEVQIRNPGSEAHTVEVAFDSGNSTADPADVDNFGTQTVTFPASASNGDRETVTVDLNAFSGDATRDARFVLQNPSADVRIGAANTYTFDIGDAPRVLISRYIDTSSGSTPKGLQLWNVSGETIDFSTDPLEVFTSFNGGETTSTTTVDTGTLAADDILIVGASDDEGDPDDLGTKAAACTPEVQFVEEQSNTWFNGNDAVRIRLDGRTEDMIGIVGEDPGEGNSWNGNGVSTKDQYLGVQPGTTSGNRNGFTDPSTRFLTLNEDPTTADGDAGGFCNAPWPEASFLASEATVVQGDTEATTLGASLQLIPAEGRATDVTVTFDETSSSASSGNIDGFTSSTLTFPGGSAQDTTETVLDLTFPTNTSQDGPLEAVFTSDVETADCFTAECFAEARSESLTITILDSESTPDVLISEFMARPDAVPDADGEWVELYNSTDSDIDLSGWSLQTTASAEADLSGVTLPVRSFLTVCGNDNASENGGVRCDLQADIELDDT
ncbi:MAG: lamin tail domain-containing protein, partial [Longimonas sp.]|uniref:lamin tail domain-containing protein n=1 Tax=Longimonas sp. TaxID=2039626 RepID=UPI0039752403